VFQGHVKKITSACFNPNGYEAITAGVSRFVNTVSFTAYNICGNICSGIFFAGFVPSLMSA
jgi:hypothetical protein